MKVVKLSTLKSNPNNPRVVRDDKFVKLKKSIEEFPDMLNKRPIVAVTEKDGKLMVLGGNMRLRACQELGLKEVPVILADEWTEEQRQEFIVKDNVGYGEWDWAALGNDWNAEQLESWGLDLPDTFAEDEEVQVKEDEVPDVRELPVSRTGDLWLLGEHRLLCGDSTKTEDVERLMDGQRADLMLTDPPYNVNYTGGTGMKIANDSMADDDFRKFLITCFKAAFAIMKPGAAFYIFHADSEGYNFRGAVKECNQVVRQCLIWAKNALVMGRQDYQWQHEPCLYGWKEGASHGWYSDRKQTTLMHFDRPSRSEDHPTMKPIALFAYLMGNSTAPQGLTYDPFLGSGTTLIAAEQLGRKCYGMEISPQYCDVIVRRWQQLTGKQAIHEARGDTFADQEKEVFETAVKQP